MVAHTFTYIPELSRVPGPASLRTRLDGGLSEARRGGKK